MAYRLAKGALGFATGVYFREIGVVDPPPPDVGGRLFAANHWNGIVDPLVILTTAPFMASPVAKNTLWKIPGLRWLLDAGHAVPVMRRQDVAPDGALDNDAMFDRVAELLKAGGNVLIFPEGVSHNEPHVLPLKTGAARMLARAQALGGKGLTLQAVALDFDARDTFRSRALVTYGPVHEVDAMPQAPGELVLALVASVADDLDRLVISGQSHGELVLVRQVAEILAGEDPTSSLGSQAEIARTVVEEARGVGVDDPRYRGVADAVTAYMRELEMSGLTDAQVARGSQAFPLRRVLRGLYLLAIVPLALLGALLYLVPYLLPKLAPRLARGETDIVSTYKLGIGLVAFPLWTALLLGAICFVTVDGWLRGAAWALVLASPHFALVWLDRLDDRRGRRLWKRATRSGRRELRSLSALRRRALDAIAAAR